MWIVVLGLFVYGVEVCAYGVLHELGASTTGIARVAATKLGWWTLLVALAAMLLSAWERANEFRFAGILLLGTVTAQLIASLAGAEVAVASMLRWELAVYGFFIVVIISARDQLLPLRHRHRWRGITEISDAELRSVRIIGWLCSAIPVIVLTGATAVMASRGLHPNGPLSATWFARIGTLASFATPLVLVAISLLMSQFANDKLGTCSVEPPFFNTSPR